MTEKPNPDICPLCGTDVLESLRGLASNTRRLDRSRDHLLRLLAEGVVEILVAAALPNSGSEELSNELQGQVCVFEKRRRELDEGVDPDVRHDDGE